MSPPKCQLCQRNMVPMPSDSDDVPDDWDFDAFPPMYMEDQDHDDGHLFVCVSCSTELECSTGIYTYTCIECDHPLYMKECTNVIENTTTRSPSSLPGLKRTNETLDRLQTLCESWTAELEETLIDVSFLDTTICSEWIILRGDDRELTLFPMGEESKSYPISLECRNQQCMVHELQTELMG